MKNIIEVMKIIETSYTIIPLLQRNYKWTMECAAQLAEDLWENFNKNNDAKYQLNMITIYKDEKNNKLQILDGQQRIITLKLLLAFLEPEKVNFNFAFERDFTIDERNGRQYFIDKLLKMDSFFYEAEHQYQFSVDTKRLYNNFVAMIFPVSFRDILEVYNDVNRDKLKKEKKGNVKDSSSISVDTELIYHNKIKTTINNKLFMYDESIKNDLIFNNDELKIIQIWCKEFNEKFSKQKNKDEEDSNDEVRTSWYSEKFMNLWISKVKNLISKKSLSGIKNEIKNRQDFIDFIKNKVDVLYHETSSRPIDEFLNINENKTRFVISDYIRANMISDNPLTDENKYEQNLKNRKSVLKVFTQLSEYLYSNKYKHIWDLVKTRYDDFEKNKDINRLKIVFCDKYRGTSTRGYEFNQELYRLQYFQDVLQNLSDELELEDKVNWNTYNAVYMLLECKKKYRFFNLFNEDDIENKTELKDITVREKFCFFEWAYSISINSEDPWDISYFLESQLYDERCTVKKASDLPKVVKKTKDGNIAKIENNEWCFVSRGDGEDSLHKALKVVIDSKKSIE